ncbi:MAG: low affinity iron permease family protein [Bacteroidota bacterium]|nr:low affinity iron permease family protein [Bacteroidota bacterium]
MAKSKKNTLLEQRFEDLALDLTKFAGTTTAFVLAVSIVIIWIICGPVFNYSHEWQLSIHIGTSIITFLMVFLIQRAQNKDTMAIQLKLDEIIAALHGASNKLVNAENLSEKDLKSLKGEYEKNSKMQEKDLDGNQTHSIEERGTSKKIKLQTKKK